MSRSRVRARRTVAASVLVAGLAVVATACTPPGGDTEEPTTGTTTGAASAVATTCGEEPVELKAYIETGFPLPKALFDEFTKQNPNVTFDVREDQFAVITQNAPRVLADDPPDLMRLPQMSELAKDGLLLNLDPYAAAYGWDEWPESQLVQMRVDENGQRGTGPLWAMGLNTSMTGVFYNKQLAEQIGMTEAPATLEELDGYLQAAKDAGIVPIAQFNGGATGGLAFPLQNLMTSYGEPTPINDWIFQKEGATIDTPDNLKGAQHLDEWIKAGYFAEDANSMDYPTMMSRFIGGESLFMFDGDWESGNLDKQMPGNAGFFVMPPAAEGGKQAAMSAPLTYGVAAQAEHADCAVFFLDWAATNDEARTIGVEVGGSRPMGPADAFMPDVDPSTVTAQTLAAGATVSEDNGAMDFIANATGSIYAKSWTPNLQKLFAGQQTPEGMLKAVQQDYESEIG